MFEKIIAVILSSATSFTSSITGANIEQYTLPENNYIQEAVNDGVNAVADENSEVSIAILDRSKNNLMRTTLETAHSPMELGSLARIFILIKAVSEDKELINETTNNPVISMVADYSKKDTDDLWEQYGGSKIISDLALKYDLQETIPNESWSKSMSSSVDVVRLIRRFLDDTEISDNQKNWAVALMGSTSTSVQDQDFSYGIPNARGVSSQTGGEGSSPTNNIAWIQGAPMDTDAGLYKHSVAVFGNDNNYIASIMVKYPEDISNDKADEIINKVAQAAVSEESLEMADTTTTENID